MCRFPSEAKKNNSISVVRFPFICYAGAFFVVLVVFVVNHFHYIRISSTTHRLLSIWVLEQLQRITFICSIQLRHCALRALNGDCIYDLIRNLNALNCACWWNSMCTYFSSSIFVFARTDYLQSQFRWMVDIGGSVSTWGDHLVSIFVVVLFWPLKLVYTSFVQFVGIQLNGLKVGAVMICVPY